MNHSRVHARSLEGIDLKVKNGLCRKKLLNEWHHDKSDCEGCSGYDNYCPNYNPLKPVFRNQENILYNIVT